MHRYYFDLYVTPCVVSFPERPRTHYAYPPSPTSPSSPTGTSANSRPVPLSQRLRALQSELAALETELADPSNPRLAKEREDDNVDPGELIRGLVDVRGRLEKIRKGKEGRGRLVGVVLGEAEDVKAAEASLSVVVTPAKDADSKKDHVEDVSAKSDMQNIVEMDRRVGELERLVGSSSAALDEVGFDWFIY